MNRLDYYPDRIVKTFTSRKAFEAELAVYSKALAQTPRLLEHRDLEIQISRLDAVPFIDLRPISDISLLAECIAAFHEAFFSNGQTLCHWDNNPKNILWDGIQYYLIDFEDSRLAYPEYDISHLLMFWLELPDPRTHIEAFLKRYQSRIKLDPKLWKQSLALSKTRFIDRRNKYGKPLPRVFYQPSLLEELLILPTD